MKGLLIILLPCVAYHLILAAIQIKGTVVHLTMQTIAPIDVSVRHTPSDCQS